jgi:regulatory protein
VVDAYVLALSWLARRELSEQQVRTRLARRGCSTEDIDAAVARLVQERAIDDGRVAGAFARTAAGTRLRGRSRVEQDLLALGIDGETARRALETTFAELDEGALLDRALSKKWPVGASLDERGVARVCRALLRQGFAPDQIMAALRARGADV